MNPCQLRIIFIFQILVLPLLGWSNSLADSPTAEVKSTVDQVLKILSDPRYKGDANKEERRKLLRDTISPRFDYEEMARRSLGAEWRRRTSEEQKEFVKLFTDLLEKAYVLNIESYDNEKFTYNSEKIDAPYAEVNGKIRTTEGEEIKMQYRLHRIGGAWKVYDLVIEGISLVNNYRSQFNRVLSQSSYKELVRRIGEKAQRESGK